MPASQERRFKRNVKGHTSTAYHAAGAFPSATQIEQAAQAARREAKRSPSSPAPARAAPAPELEQVAERLGAPIVKAAARQGLRARDSPYTTGGIGVVGTRASVDALKACDGLLIVGSCFPYIEFLPKPGQAVGVQIDDKPEHIGLRYPVDIGLVGDAQATLAGAAAKLPRNDDRSFLEAGAEGHARVVGADGGARHDAITSRCARRSSPGTCRICWTTTRSSAAIPAP